MSWGVIYVCCCAIGGDAGVCGRCRRRWGGVGYQSEVLFGQEHGQCSALHKHTPLCAKRSRDSVASVLMPWIMVLTKRDQMQALIRGWDAGMH
jgi:hypothetical protein